MVRIRVSSTVRVRVRVSIWTENSITCDAYLSVHETENNTSVNTALPGFRDSFNKGQA